MAAKSNQRNQLGSRRDCLLSVVGVGVLLAAASPSLGIEFSAGIRSGCEVEGLSASRSGGLNAAPVGGSATFCVCACDSGGTCSEDGCSSTGDCSGVTISAATLVQDGECTVSGTAIQVLCNVGCGNLVSATVPLTPDQQCAMAAGELQIFLETTPLGDTLLDVLPAKGVGEPVLPHFCSGGVPAASDWGLASLCLLTMIVGTVALRSRPQ